MRLQETGVNGIFSIVKDCRAAVAKFPSNLGVTDVQNRIAPHCHCLSKGFVFVHRDDISQDEQICLAFIACGLQSVPRAGAV